jgi:osmotically-inducible protein OsmY
LKLLRLRASKSRKIDSTTSYSRNIVGTFFIQVLDDGRSAEEAEMMNSGHAQFAEALVFVHGLGAEAEAAMHANLCEKSGDSEIAEEISTAFGEVGLKVWHADVSAGVVHITGTTSDRERAAATSIAQSVRGVRRVIVEGSDA